ncbi:hypothetical protein HanPSC8_Chr17g0755781 [Helianthus annuus]|nr:hypothetical protein HanPSC8_Chr17g0755781 [Helianthus annuus]
MTFIGGYSLVFVFISFVVLILTVPGATPTRKFCRFARSESHIRSYGSSGIPYGFRA